MEKKEVKDLLAKSAICLSLDRYDDIFSDFDPRPYSERALSDDFMAEARKVARDRRGSLELELLLPAALRNPSVEAKIRKRLKEHFKKHRDMLRKADRSIRWKGISVALSGFILMVLATYLYEVEDPHFIFSFIRTAIEPAGWFMVWYGLDQIFYTREQHKADLEFYSKMSKVTIRFTSV